MCVPRVPWMPVPGRVATLADMHLTSGAGAGVCRGPASALTRRALRDARTRTIAFGGLFALGAFRRRDLLGA